MARIRYNLSAFQQIRRLPEVDALLQREVNAILDEVGGLEKGYDGDVRPGKTRSRGSVVTVTAEAVRDNSVNQSLLRALANRRV